MPSTPNVTILPRALLFAMSAVTTLCLVAPSLAGATSSPASAPSLSAPIISRLDAAFLTHTVRRALTRRLRERAAYELPYVPHTLQFDCRVSVSLRRNGRLIATADSSEASVARACIEAAEASLTSAQRVRPLTAEDLSHLNIEIELIGPRQEVGTGALPSEQVASRYKLGFEGISVRLQQREILVRPSQLISMEIFCANDEELGHRCNRYQVAIDNLYKKLGLDTDPPSQPPESVRLSRFRTAHWVEPAPGQDPVLLVAGMMPISQDAVTREHLLEGVDDLARYIRYRQNSDGLFSYEFLPGRDMYWPDQNWVRQTATCWALALHSSRRDNTASAESLDRGLAVFRKMLRPLAGVNRAVFLNTPDDKNPLGATALLCLAMLDARRPEAYASDASSLVAALAAMQRRDGSFRTCFPPADVESSQDYFPGEALLAIARQYSRTRDADLREICDRALPFYQRYFRATRPPMFVPWQTQTWGQLARATQLRKYADFVFEMSDFLLPRQIQGRTGYEAIYEGGFDVHGNGRAGIASAVYVEGLVDAVLTARAFHETQRAARYEDAIRRASRFIVQLRFRPEEAFYVQSPRDVIGAVRDTPSDPVLRIDHNQHALAALLGAAQLSAPTE